MGLFNGSNNIEEHRLEMLLENKKDLTSNEVVHTSKEFDNNLNMLINSENPFVNFSNINSVINKEVLILITDINGVIVYLNEKCSESLGYHPNELIGKHTRIFKTGIHSTDFYSHLWSTLLAGGNWKGEITAKRKDGSIEWNFMCIYPLLDENQRIHQFLTIRSSITDLKKKKNKPLLKINILTHFLKY